MEHDLCVLHTNGKFSIGFFVGVSILRRNIHTFGNLTDPVAAISNFKIFCCFPSSRLIVDQLSTWDLDTMTFNRKINEHSLVLMKSAC